MIDCALIGCGYWGSKLKRYIDGSSNLRLKYVCDSRFDLNKVWADDSVKAVVVATPNDTHYPIVKAALSHGKNVFSEKPLAMQTGECVELANLASDNKLVLLVEYTYTFSQGLNKARAIIRDGEIGRILGIEMAVRHLGRFKGGSVYWLLGSHMLSVLDMFTQIKNLEFQKTDLVEYEGTVETGVISFRNSDLSGQIVVSLNYTGKETRVIIYGKKGTIIYNPLIQPTLQIETYERLGWTVAEKLPRSRREFQIDESNNLYHAVERFNAALEGKAGGNAARAVSITKILEDLHTP